MGQLNRADLTLKLSSADATARLETAQRQILALRLVGAGLIGNKGRLGPGLCVLFEGWDASGKGGALKRLAAPLDPRHVHVAQFAAPTPEELRHHFLWRFSPSLPGRGGMSLLDRSWYGRVLVERVEGIIGEREWTRAYGDITDFEKMLAADGLIIVKFWMHISQDEQLRRFRSREHDPLRSWKLTPEDWRNRDHAKGYVAAVEEMLVRTDHAAGRWTVVEAEDKRYARVKVLETVVQAYEAGLKAQDFDLPPATT